MTHFTLHARKLTDSPIVDPYQSTPKIIDESQYHKKEETSAVSDTDCVTWSFKLEGSKYTHAWESLTYPGLLSDEFEVITINAESDLDPQSGQCLNFDLSQLLLVTKTGYLVAPLSCSNQEISILQKKSEPRECFKEDLKLRELSGPFAPKPKGPSMCRHFFGCGECISHGATNSGAEEIISGEEDGSVCVWCEKEGSCKPYNKAKSDSLPCSKAVGIGNGLASKCTDEGNTLYLSFFWNNGRVNNNMVALAAALSVSKHMKRILILSQPIQKASHFTGYRRGDNNHGKSAFLGILEGMWDMEFLRSKGFKVAFETEIPKKILEISGYNTPSHCRFASGYPDNSKFPTCKVVLLTQPFQNYKDLKSQRPKEFVRPAKWLRDASERIIEKKIGSRIELSVHQRHHNWGNAKKHGSKFLCRGSLKNIFTTKIGKEYREAIQNWHPDKEERHKMLALTQLSCAANFSDLQQVLGYWKQNIPERFFMASDREEIDRYEDMIKHGAVTIEKEDFKNMPEIKAAFEKHNSFGWDCSYKYCAPYKKFLQLTGVYLDMWGMTLGKFFMGGYYSTMSDTVCFWRGWNRMNDSNICFLPHRLQKKWVRPGIDVDIPK
eukprot:CAMPEP_0167753964 /NCGR_PEP_ID=MMETSP0110_2-20121227/8007_1 /TAXON_ID=629695 /ORGANISM="Gymnochlora sp., Strain CCMP2014" /LENGTH=606 /DNA_ID=CAMNT_0007639791 /DNA_START=170 /DNA_END=1987 /DNA_ORIENTATION=+